MATPPKRPTYLFGTEALFPEKTGADTPRGAARGNSAAIPGMRPTSTPGADAILNDPRSRGSRRPPQVRAAFDQLKNGILDGVHRAKDEFLDRVDRVKGDAIGAGIDAATSFEPIDRLLSTYQRTGWSASPPAPAQPASQPVMSDKLRRLADIIQIGEGNYESYNTGTKGVAGNRVGRPYFNPPAGTVTGKTINQILATDSLPGAHPNRMHVVGAYQMKADTLALAKKQLKLTGEERFTPELQDRIFADFLISKAGGGRLADFIKNGRGTVDDAQYAAAKEWASVAVPAGYAVQNKGISDGTMSYYSGPANKANVRATQALRAFLTDLRRQPRREDEP